MASGGDFRSEGRRAFVSRSITAAFGALVIGGTRPAIADGTTGGANEPSAVEVYFGTGCFWHVQHEFVAAERSLLGRTDDALTARVGYAGGNAGSVNGKVCYHNSKSVSDYGKLGHAEVVSVRIPPSRFGDFAAEYCKLFRNGYRADQVGDRGSEYRNLVGIPGGIDNPLSKQLIEASAATNGDMLDFAVGKGDDEDIARLVWVMDTEKYPFFKGERYHQFHDGFMKGENYPSEYNKLIDQYGEEDFVNCPPRL